MPFFSLEMPGKKTLGVKEVRELKEEIECGIQS